MENVIEYPKSYKFIFFVIFLLLGLINNIGGVLIITCAQQFSQNWNMPQLVAWYPLASILCSSLSRIWNSRFCLKLRYLTRITIIASYFFSGYISLFVILQVVEKNENFSKWLAFCLTMIPSLIMGTGAAFGEANILGYLRTFPKDYVAGWSTGTGFAGIAGASIPLLFKIYDVKTKFLYWFISPITLVYWFCFYLTMILKEKAEKDGKIRISQVQTINFEKVTNNSENKENTDNKEESDNSDYKTNQADGNAVTQLKSDISNDSDNNNQASPLISSSTLITDVKENRQMSLENFKEAFGCGKRYIINLAIVYYWEYTIYTGLAERVSKYKYVKDEKIAKYLYESFCLCYQFGVLCSRSSLFIVKRIAVVEIYTFCQFANLIMWLVEVFTGYIITWWILFIHLIIVGLFGGASYVGCFYFLINTPTIDAKLKELCWNIGTIFNDLGILSASVTVLILDMTIFKVKDS